ncbi:MAG: RHS repeat protein, partial [Clostridia bacterium]|nr:RHS repeat protein [Clostridia bacterium]
MDKQRRKRVNFITKAVSILLIVVMMIVFLPETMTVLAEEIKSAGTESEQSQQVEQEQESTYEPDFSVGGMHSNPAEQEEAYILYEAEYKRSEYEKHFYMSNGTYMRETYAMPIHYLDGEEYKDIDNTLVEYTEGGKERIKNAGNSFTAEFAKEISEDEPLLSVTKGDYSLEMYYEQKGGDKAQQARLGEQGKATIRPVRAEIKVDKAKAAKQEQGYAGKKLKDSIKNENLESELRYSGVEQDTDFEYKLDSNSVKESIIVGSRQQSYTYSFRLQTKNLFLEHDNYGRIRAYNAQEEEIYTIPAPYMFDAAGNRSEAVTYELKYTKDSDYILSVIADSEWINAEERIFPVTIDPTIETAQDSGCFKFTEIQGSEKETDSGESVRYSVSQPEGLFQDGTRLVVQYRNGSDKRVTHRELRFKLTAWTAVAGYRYNHNFDYEVTWESTQEAMYYEFASGILTGEAEPTDYTEEAIYFTEDDRGFVFKCVYETAGIISSSALFFDFKVVEYYDDEMGIESTYNPYSYDGGDYTLYVKPRTETYTVEIPYISLEAPSVPLSVTAYYNPGFGSLRKELYQASDGYYGANIKLNIEQYIKPLYNESGSDDAVLYFYLDADGSVHRFLPYDTDKYLCPELGYTYIPSTKEVKDSSDFVIMEFDANGRLVWINSKNGDSIHITYLNETNKILYIENYISGAPYQALSFTYNGNRLAEIVGTFAAVPMFSELNDIEETSKAVLTYQGNYLSTVRDSQQNYRVRIVHSTTGELVTNRYNIGHEIEKSTEGETVVYYVDSNGDKSRANQFYGGANYVQRDNYNDMLNKNPGFETPDSMVTYGFSNDKTVTSQWSESMENDHAPIDVNNTVVKKTEEKTVTTTVTATFDQRHEKRGFFEPYYNFSQDIAMPINEGYLDQFNNPVFACLLTSGTGFEGSIYYKDGDETVKSATADGGSITIFGMYLLLPLPKTATEIGVIKESGDGTGAYLQKFGIAELVSKTVTEVYVKDVKNENNETIHKVGDTKITTVTAEGTTVTHISEEKTLKEEYVGKVGSESSVTTYTYSGDLLTKAVTVTTIGDEVTTQTTSYTYNGYLVQSVTTKVEKKIGNQTELEEKTYTESYTYNDFGHMLSHTTTDNHEYTYEYIRIWECAEILPYRVYYDEELVEEYTYDIYGKLLSITDNKGTMEYLYNGNKFSGYKSGDTTYGYTLGENGNVSGITRNGENVISYTSTRDAIYDVDYANGDKVDYYYGDNGVDRVRYSNGSSVQGEYTYDYDIYGTLESVTNQDDITKTYSQNIAARTYTERQTGANYIYDNITHYDSNGYYTGTTYGFISSPHEGVNMQLQSLGRVSSVEYKSYLQGLVGSTADGDFTSSYSYNAENFIREITQTLGEESVSTAYEYDYNNRLTKVTVNGTIYRLTYDYMGNITAVTKNNAEYLTYSYDDAGRLISENNTEFSYRYSYTYDGNNNIASVTSIGTPTSNTPPFPPITSRP